MTATAPAPSRAVLLGVQLPGVDDRELASSLDELARLAKTLGFSVIARVTQRRARLDPGVVVGAGKLKELADWTGGTGVVPVGPPRKKPSADEESKDESESEPEEGTERDSRSEADRARLVLVDHELSPSQARNLERATGAEVLDRTAVILAIFQRHAKSREARLQVEIARLSYIAPRLRETGGGRDREGGGIGGRGAGESASELDRRKVRDRIAELRAELESIEHEAGTRRKRRARQNTAALVGYTNAGKSSWMRALTASDVLVEDKLFATLGTTVRALRPEGAVRVLVSDTVGFIKHLPHDLVASFRSTLEEARESDLLVHVVDASDPAHPDQIEVVREVLASIGAAENPRLLVLNKADRLDDAMRAQIAAAHPDALVLSAKRPDDAAALRSALLDFFERDLEETELVVPYALGRVVAEAHEHGHVLAESHDDAGTRLVVRAPAEVLARLRAALRG
jgi:GTP-binding protein HflX